MGPLFDDCYELWNQIISLVRRFLLWIIWSPIYLFRSFFFITFVQSSVSFQMCRWTFRELLCQATTKMRRKQSDDVDDDENNIFTFIRRCEEHIQNIFDSMRRFADFYEWSFRYDCDEWRRTLIELNGQWGYSGYMQNGAANGACICGATQLSLLNLEHISVKQITLLP